MRAGPQSDSGVVEADETSFDDEDEVTTRTKRGKSGLSSRRAVVSLVERSGMVRSFHVDRADQATVTGIVTPNVAKEATACTDESRLYGAVSAPPLHRSGTGGGSERERGGLRSGARRDRQAEVHEIISKPPSIILRAAVALMQLDHVNVHVYDLAAARDFLMQLLGVKVGWRPSFKVPGDWLYLDGRPVIHTWLKSQDRGLGWADHIAFAPCGDPDEKRAELRRLGFAFTESALPDTDVTQFMVSGPEGIKIELQCQR